MIISQFRYAKRGVIFGAEFGTIVSADVYAIRIEATDRAAYLLFALGVEFCYVGPEQDSGRAWYQFDYSDRLDAMLVALVEFAAAIREHEPNFGQLELAL
jgi:hypothetical protein